MSLTRREILEQLARLGIRTIDGLKRGCREYEAYWTNVLGRPSCRLISDAEESLIPEP
ncbi:MAG TPA: hypothetical protein PLA18_02425 [Deltaproteobacteria bacterium]|jgi:hypothetical protein|nr:hypothetical protein [Deltaproteobacteria bacterium]